MAIHSFSCGLLVLFSAWFVGCGNQTETKNGKGPAADGRPNVDSQAKKNADKPAANGIGKDAGKVEVAAEVKKLDGHWTCVQRFIVGKELFPHPARKDFSIKDGKLIPQPAAKDGVFKDIGWEEGVFLLDPTAKPMRMDFRFTTGENKDKVMKGIYNLDDDKWVWCFNNDIDGARPATFDADKLAETMEVNVHERSELKE